LIEVDCLEIINLVNNKEVDHSVFSTMIEDIKTVLKVRQTCITHAKRYQNTRSHFMANFC
jgi:aspartate carbamoyltransferase regulatory subunit